ncbi:MAG: hypothetical protein ACRDQ4_04910 [Pseudonocardiaceae bacterium]
MDQVLGLMLQQAVWDRLDMLDELVSSADNRSLLSLAHSELPRLTHGWRALLATHTPDRQGRCPECSSRWRPRAAPCSVWRAAQEHLVSAEAVSSDTVDAKDGARRVLPRMRHPRSLFPARVPAGVGVGR